ncbi:MAG: bifunctional demethylmenaquinone methyltransferase/2-methoxy-6-polyprenyl-1,4-benzoquinol methylase [Legionellales bacterium RIFCSPHIGHO2_12_FULL_42_9]|nr:MAG: bifunctional demethylmenaquinone methyltransferase/2-methoxy-6-polyprenyl-1,4-benzoquinol methylase [Legionellales bacterium RIFCSPHIGHO2_12_FULL_42_9]
MHKSTHPDTTHFGFKTIPWDEKEHKVRDVFKSVANKYDLMNDLMSLSLHRFWKKYTIALSHIRPGQVVLDLAGGSGDLTYLMSKRVGAQGAVVMVDINAAMLDLGRNKLLDLGVVKNVQFIQADAQNLPLPSDYFNCITIGFGLRNITDKNAALQSMYRVCRPGGEVIILEFSTPNIPWLKTWYDWYSFNFLPKLGNIVTHDAASYTYLVESIRMHPNQENLKQLIENAGFEDCKYYNLTGGIVTVHHAYKY